MAKKKSKKPVITNNTTLNPKQIHQLILAKGCHNCGEPEITGRTNNKKFPYCKKKACKTALTVIDNSYTATKLRLDKYGT